MYYHVLPCITNVYHLINNHKVCFQLLHDRSDRSKMVQGTQVHLQTQADEVHEGYEAAGHVEIKTVLGKPCEICEAWDFSAVDFG